MSRRKLLLADDSLTIQKVVNLTFADEGIDVVTVGDGDTAIEMIAEVRPDLVLADVHMPGLSGYQICEVLRENSVTKDIPVVLLVGSFEPFDEAEAARVGANAYLTKPFQSIRQLVAQVSELIEASPSVWQDANGDSPVSFEDEGHFDEHQTEEPDGLSIASEEENIEQPEVAAPLPLDESEHDIEDLYDQSVHSATGLETSEYGDVGIDDEMIETSYSAADANSDLMSFGAEAGSDSSRQMSVSADDSGQQTATESWYDAPAPERYIPEPEPEPGSQPEAQFDSETQAEHEADPVAKTEQYTSGEIGEFQQGASQFLEGDTHDLAGSISEFVSPPAETSSAVPLVQQPSASIGEETIRMEGRFDTTTSSAFQFDDLDLLEIPQTAEGGVEITTPLNAVERGATQQVVTISPELIEMIAQRVVEKLSEKY